MVVYGTVLDTLLSHSVACRARSAVVVRTLHASPYSHRDVRRGASPRHPTSPIIGRIDDGPDPFVLFGARVRIMDLSEVRDGQHPPDACQYVFSPVTWMGETRVRVAVLEVYPDLNGFSERFVFLRRSASGWTVVLIESGMTS
jgi:hypothetical protein